MGVLKGSRAVVTGGASGIGQAIATAFAAEGADVTIFDRADEDRLAVAATAVAQAGGKVHARRVNVAYEEEIVTAFDALAGQGGIDILVSSAGLLIEKSLLQTSAADFDRLMAVNLRGLFLYGPEA
jgi:3-oxoacyl-[acyl-carrier protein] reductase